MEIEGFNYPSGKGTGKGGLLGLSGERYETVRSGGRKQRGDYPAEM